MPKTIYGIGTKEYGKRNLTPEGSCITTKFFVFLYIPLWPLNSRQVRVQARRKFVDVIVEGFCWPQVIKILAVGYGICLAVLAALGGLILVVLGLLKT